MSLLADLEAFLREAGMGASTFSKKAMGDPGFVKRLRDGMRVGPQREERARAFMASHGSADTGSPVAVGEVAVSSPPASPARKPTRADRLAAEVRAEAEASSGRRMQARIMSTADPLPALRLTPAEKVQALYLEEPSDVVDLARRQWPTLWAQLMRQARAANVSPVSQLMSAIAAGVLAIDEDAREAAR